MTWAIDSRRFAKKVKLATSGCTDAERSSTYDDDETEKCSECGQPKPDATDTAPTQEWLGLPAGVKFDPNDKEILDHLAAKIGRNGSKPHFLLDEFIPTLEGDDGICYTHPEKLPGVKSDGRSCHFFHRPANAYTKGTRKRRKVHTGDDDNGGETRWHKTGKTRPVQENGEQIGWKKIMVLYTNFKRKSKPKKTNWVMHQYHLGDAEDERDGEMVVSKVFFQTQPRSSALRKANESDDEDCEAVEGQQPQASTSDEPAVTAASKQPVPSTPEVISSGVLRPCPSREARIEFLPPLAERPLQQREVSLSIPTTESALSLVRCAPCATNAVSSEARELGDLPLDELFCNEDLCADIDLGSSQDFRSFAAELGLPVAEDDAFLDWNDLDVGLDALEDISSQEMRDWFKPKGWSQEAGDSQSGT